jgi:hypothetical protein
VLSSIAVIERFIRSLKREHLRRILIPLSRARLEDELGCFQRWYNEERPHQAFDGRTPKERADDSPMPPRRFEPRPRFPISSHEPHVKRCDDLELIVTPFEGRTHLPTIELRASA